MGAGQSSSKKFGAETSSGEMSKTNDYQVFPKEVKVHKCSLKVNAPLRIELNLICKPFFNFYYDFSFFSSIRPSVHQMFYFILVTLM